MLSIVVPVYNEAESIGPLVDAVRRALAPLRREDWELVFVDDGSSDDTAAEIERRIAAEPRVRLVQLARNVGQTTAMMAGFAHASGSVIVTMDGDLQNDPEDIGALIAKIDEGYDLVAGWRVNRQDKLVTRKVPSWIANRIIAWLTGIPIKDNGCSLKAYRRPLLERMTLYSDMHRFIPAIASLSGARIAQIPVRHHARRYGMSKYGLGRIFRVVTDLVSLRMLTRFRERPLVGFAWLGSAALVLAAVFVAAWVIAFTQFRVQKAVALVFPGAAFVWLATAVFLFMLGFVAEAVVRQYGRSGQSPLVREWSPQ